MENKTANPNFNMYKDEDIISSPIDYRAINACKSIYNISTNRTLYPYNRSKCEVYVGDSKDELWDNVSKDISYPLVGLCFDADYDDPFLYMIECEDDDGRDYDDNSSASYIIIKKNQ